MLLLLLVSLLCGGGRGDGVAGGGGVVAGVGAGAGVVGGGVGGIVVVDVIYVVDVVGVIVVGSGDVVGVILSSFVFCSKVIHLKKSCLFVWINYRQEQILKADHKDKAGIFSKKRLLKVFFIKWKNKVS